MDEKMNGKENPIELLVISLVMIVLGVAGVIAGFSRGPSGEYGRPADAFNRSHDGADLRSFTFCAGKRSGLDRQARSKSGRRRGRASGREVAHKREFSRSFSAENCEKVPSLAPTRRPRESLGSALRISRINPAHQPEELPT